jgi:hypothetical protein
LRQNIELIRSTPSSRLGEELAIPIVLVDEESRDILQRVVDKTGMLVNLNIKASALQRILDLCIP